MSNFSDFFPTSTGGGDTGAGNMPNTDVFVANGVWTVPTSVKTIIDSEGSAPVGLLMVGGGSVITTAASDDTRSGEVVQEVYLLSRNDYDAISVTAEAATISDTTITFSLPTVTITTDSLAGRRFTLDGNEYIVASNTLTVITLSTALQSAIDVDTVLRFYENIPTVSVFVGGINEPTGLTTNYLAAPTVSQTNSYTYDYQTTAFTPSNQFTISNSSFIRTSGGKAFIKSISISQVDRTTGGATFVPQTPIWTGTEGAATIGASSITFAEGSPGLMTNFKLTWTRGYGYPNTFTNTFTYSNGVISVAGIAGGTGTPSTTPVSATITYATDGQTAPTKQAREGSNVDYADFFNNTYSSDGLGGYGKNRIDTPAGTSLLPTFYGSPGQGGYLQLFYS